MCYFVDMADFYANSKNSLLFPILAVLASSTSQPYGLRQKGFQIWYKTTRELVGMGEKKNWDRGPFLTYMKQFLYASDLHGKSNKF